MRKLLIIFTSLLFSYFLVPQVALADYDRNLILTDLEFNNYNTMSAGQINDFLVSKGSVFANYVIPEYVEVPFPYQGGNWATVSTRQINDVTRETLYGKTVAQLIYDEAQQHNVNPQVILVIIQKESSAITQSSVSATRMAWPMFYGFNEVMASFGYDYNTARQRALDYGGVGQQIAYATANLRNKYTNWANGTYGDWRARIVIDGVEVYPQSICTRFFYQYTPHMWTNFYNIFRNWFGSGSYLGLIRPDDSETVYFIKDGIKYPIDNPDTFAHWGFSWASVNVISPDLASTVPTGGWIKQLVKNEGNKVYRILAGYRRWIFNQDAASFYGFDVGQASALPESVIAILPQDRTLAYLVRGSSPAVYLIDGNIKRPILNPESFDEWGFAWNEINVSDSLANSFPTGSFISSLIKGSGPAVFLIDNGNKKLVPNPDIFAQWGLQWGEISQFSDSLINVVWSDPPLKRLAKGPGPVIFLIDRGVKYPIPNPDIFLNWGFRWEDVSLMSLAFLDSRPTLPWLKRLAKGSSPAVYLMDQDMKKLIQSPQDFSEFGFRPEDITVVSDQFLSFYREIILHRLVKSSAPAVYVIEQGRKRLVPDPATFIRYRFNWNDISPVSDQFLYFYPQGAALR